mmetsp:Transcript_3366/g.4935  ORF Transcript_3366/g.4935 Transcript_3366/m.4935 type:complete len:345 (-) Transcript_3366:61-1095(-)
MNKGQGGEFVAATALTTLMPASKEDNSQVEFKIPVKFTRCGRKMATPFPMKLMKILSCKDYEDIVAWLPDGKSFRILNPKEFTATILPLHLKEAKYSSFKRKMHRWGFEHTRSEGNGGAKCFGLEATFSHEHFQRNRLDLIQKMACAKIPLSKCAVARAKAASDPQKTPCVPAASAPIEINKSRSPAVPSPVSKAASPSMSPASPLRLPPRKRSFALPETFQITVPQLEPPRKNGPILLETVSDPMQLPIQNPNQINLMSTSNPDRDISGPSHITSFPRHTNQLSLMSIQKMRLDAAIELEVTRRMNETLNATAFTRDERMSFIQMRQNHAPPPSTHAYGNEYY